MPVAVILLIVIGDKDMFVGFADAVKPIRRKREINFKLVAKNSGMFFKTSRTTGK
ncbi:hypothetical protein SDC9_181851 [bioreactor metagenome]|uniref:Uncharacterized protein n=1 Tax=bioreactor metagenome TaxID=1076179 RepID=A0A645H5S9_9ZZZZ